MRAYGTKRVHCERLSGRALSSKPLRRAEGNFSSAVALHLPVRFLLTPNLAATSILLFAAVANFLAPQQHRDFTLYQLCEGVTER